MAKTDQHIADEMWRALLNGVAREWENLTAVKPDVSNAGMMILYSSYGSLAMSFDAERKSVHVALRPCCERPDCRTPVSKRDLVYQSVVKSDGRRGWRRATFEHDEKGMPRLLVYHLLKHREPA